MNDGMGIHINRDLLFRGVEVWIFERDDLVLSVADPLTMRKATEGTVQQSTFRMSEAMAQRLMGELWEAGFRPREYRNTQDEVAAMKEHIADLRRMAFDKAG